MGKIVEVLGDNMGTGMAVDITIHTMKFRTSGRRLLSNRLPG
ncbi:hypothetical protein ACLB1N_20505 [Escherichia coli]